MENHKINTIVYGKRIETSVEMMSDGMFELFDDFCDLVLSRLYNQTKNLESGFNFEALKQNEIARFKVLWLVSLAELMFYSMQKQPKLGHLKKEFYGKLADECESISLKRFVAKSAEIVPQIIRDDRDFTDNEIFNMPSSNRDDNDPRNKGLGPRLARIILENTFAKNSLLQPVYEDFCKTIELELNNAYGHCSIACSKFNII
ncbi:MAG: hypothetical protein VX617_06285 [Pseudomonadota bacterium]|nr:hypothetical protein [Pseudomonadota bacterium]